MKMHLNERKNNKNSKIISAHKLAKSNFLKGGDF